MTRQFFRKADAAVVVYDVTSETSFLNARQWLDSARDAIQAHTKTKLHRNFLEKLSRVFFNYLLWREGG